MRYSKVLVAIGVIGIVGVLVDAVTKFPPNDSASAASWVQAFGSIAAIVAAMVIAGRQAESDRRNRQDERVDRLRAVEVMIANCRDKLDEFQRAMVMAPANQGLKFAHPNMLSTVKTALQVVTAITPVQAPTPMSAMALIEAQTAIGESVGIIPGPDGAFHVGWHDQLNRLCTSLQQATSLLSEEISRLSTAA